MHARPSVGLLLGLGIMWLALLVGCSEPSVAPPTATGCDSLVLAGELPWATSAAAPWPVGRFSWSWTGTDPDAVADQHVVLNLSRLGDRIRARWCFRPVPTCSSELRLVPCDSVGWHAMRIPSPSSGDPPPIPLPRRVVDSSDYADVLDLLQTLTQPFFDSVVMHWPSLPVPLQLVPAVSGDVDLAACLAEAAVIWNQTSGFEYFRLASDSAWGVRLVHFAGAHLSPPLRARITRLDGAGRPLRIQIIVGDNYDGQEDRPYAVRGMVHELAHALFLWGHSSDRIHCLWGAAPPLVSAPSLDERKAALWWHGLPDGLDLKRYEAGPAGSADLQPVGCHGHRTAVQQTDRSQGPILP